MSVTLAECAFSSYRKAAVGCAVNLEGQLSQAALLFAETPSRIVLSARDANLEAILRPMTGDRNFLGVRSPAVKTLIGRHNDLGGRTTSLVERIPASRFPYPANTFPNETIWDSCRDRRVPVL